MMKRMNDAKRVRSKQVLQSVSRGGIVQSLLTPAGFQESGTLALYLGSVYPGDLLCSFFPLWDHSCYRSSPRLPSLVLGHASSPWPRLSFSLQ